MTTMTPYPCLWFDGGKAEEAANFWVSLLPNSRIDRVWRTPADTPSGPAGTVLTVDFTLSDRTRETRSSSSTGVYGRWTARLATATPQVSPAS